jgi:hypothetical protein
MDQRKQVEHDVHEFDESGFAIMVTDGAPRDGCVFCGLKSELGSVEIFVPAPRRWVCSDCAHDRAPRLARILELARGAVKIANEGQH